MNSVLYIVEDVNFVGGAHVATAHLIRRLRAEGARVDVLSDVDATEETRHRFGYPEFFRWELPNHNIPWFFRGLYKRAFRACDYPDWTIDPGGRIRNLLKKYDCVCVMSEMSPLRALVANLSNRIRKVQMIHNDYLKWALSSEFARRVTRHDEPVYQGMTKIAVVGDYNARAFSEYFPKLADKTTAFYNLIDIPRVLKRESPAEDGCLKIVTVARFDENQKATARNVQVAMKLVREGVNLRWTFMGAGYEELSKEVAAAGCADRITFPGVVKDPIRHLGKYDIMALFSHYEGVPLVVYEAFLAGTPVAATRVSGMQDQIQDGVNGWLFDDDAAALEKGLGELAQNKQRVLSAHDALVGYQYDNQRVLILHKKLLGCCCGGVE